MLGLTKLSLKRPVSVCILVLALIVFGISSIFSTPLELIPDIEMPMLVVATIYPGAAPQDVETLLALVQTVQFAPGPVGAQTAQRVRGLCRILRKNLHR